MKALMCKGMLCVLAVMLFLFVANVSEGANGRSVYQVDLKGPIPLTVGKNFPIVGYIRVNGSPARNLSFGVEDGISRQSRMVRTDSSGKFSFYSKPSRPGEATIKFIFGNQSVSRFVTVYRSYRALFNSTSTPKRYLDYYRLYVCDQSNPIVRCKVENGAIYCAIGRSTMTYCGRDRNLPNGTTMKASFKEIVERRKKLRDKQCLSDCYMKNYMKSIETLMPCTEIFCNAMCGTENNSNSYWFWTIVASLLC